MGSDNDVHDAAACPTHLAGGPDLAGSCQVGVTAAGPSYVAGVSLSRVESMALIAEAVRRSLGLTAQDLHLGLGLAVQDELRGHRPRRTRRSIRTLSALMRTSEDVLLSLSFPAFSAAFNQQPVHLIATDPDRAEYLAAGFTRIAGELQVGDIAHLPTGRNAHERNAASRSAIAVGPITAFREYLANWHPSASTIAVLDAANLRPAIGPYYTSITHLG